MLKTSRFTTLFHWGRPQLDRGIDFNGFLWTRPAGNVLFDPMELDASELAAVRERGGARWILLTNFEHLRATPALKEALGAEVCAPAEERERFGASGACVDRWFADEDDLPEELRGALRVFALRGGKSSYEAAFWLEAARALLFGDLVRSHDSGILRLLPEAKLADRDAAVESLRPLLELPAEAVLLGDGDSLFFRGGEALAELLSVATVRP